MKSRKDCPAAEMYLPSLRRRLLALADGLCMAEGRAAWW